MIKTTAQAGSSFFPVLDRMEILRVMLARTVKGGQAGMYVVPLHPPIFAVDVARISTGRCDTHLGDGHRESRVVQNMASATIALAALLRESPGCVPYRLKLGFVDQVSLQSDVLAIHVAGTGPTKCILVSAEDDQARYREIMEIDAKTTPDDVNSFELELLALLFTAAFLEERWPGCVLIEQRLKFPGRAVRTTGAICVHLRHVRLGEKIVKNGTEGHMITFATCAETAHGVPITEGVTALFLPSVG